MKKTKDLYMCTSDRWKDMTWENALESRIESATKAMDYYRRQSRNHIGEDMFLTKLYEDRYTASEKAREFNRILLKETK